MELMRESIERVLPIGGAEWEIVAGTHMTFLYPELNRDALSLRPKFNALHSSTICKHKCFLYRSSSW
jgi:hypothetical protein